MILKRTVSAALAISLLISCALATGRAGIPCARAVCGASGSCAPVADELLSARRTTPDGTEGEGGAGAADGAPGTSEMSETLGMSGASGLGLDLSAPFADGGDGSYAEITLARAAASADRVEGRDFFDDAERESITPIADGLGYVNDTVLVYAADGVPLSRLVGIFNSVGGRLSGYLAALNRYQLAVSASSLDGINEICDRLMSFDEILYASCDIAVRISDDYVPDDPWTEEDGRDRTLGWDEENPDGSNWWLEAVWAPSAWEYDEYFHHIDIGIVDSGFDTEHEELAGKVRFPKKWLARQNVPGDHSTHVAGIISAEADNGVGIAGICRDASLSCVDWKPEIYQFWSTSERIITGLFYAVRDGAKVINFSLGCSSDYNPLTDERLWRVGMDIYSGAVSFSIARLLGRGYDFIIVQSAGNGDENGEPCDAFFNGVFCGINEDNVRTRFTGVSDSDVLDRIIVVGSVRNLGGGRFERSSFSNGGAAVDICAPGSNIFGCITGGYGYMSGTSMSAPIVTATAALTWSVKPSLTGAQVALMVCDPANTVYEAQDDAADGSSGVLRLVNVRLCVEAAIALLTPEELPATGTDI